MNADEFARYMFYGDPARGATRFADYNAYDVDYIDSLSLTQAQLMEKAIMGVGKTQRQEEGYYTDYDNQIHMQVSQGTRTTIAHASITLGHGEVEERIRMAGEAYKHPDDKNDPYVGELLASARALRKLAKALERRAVGRTKFHDNARRAKRVAKRVQEIQNEHSDLVTELEWNEGGIVPPDTRITPRGKKPWNEDGPVTRFGRGRGKP